MKQLTAIKGNESEMQLFDLLEHLKQTPGRQIYLSLRPQGMNTIIEKGPLNLCMIEGHGEEYLFGGISEAFYDRMVVQFDSRNGDD